MSQLKLEALEAKFKAEMLEAKATLETYFINSVGVGEHADILKEMDAQLDKYSTAYGKLEALHDVVSAAVPEDIKEEEGE